jgi:hypothetical protein
MDELINIIKERMAQPGWAEVEEVEKRFRRYIRTDNVYFTIDPKRRDCKYLFNLYDKHVFSGKFKDNFSMTFEFSKTLTKSAGLTKYDKDSLKVSLSFSIPLIFDAFLDNHDGYKVNGIICLCPIEAFLRVMEHEIAHLCEFLMYNNSNCSKPRFTKIAYELFAHTENRHLIGLEMPKQLLHKTFHVGDIVGFVEHDKHYVGEIIRITKKATVLVGDNYHSKKYYVPAELLVRADDVSE